MTLLSPIGPPPAALPPVPVRRFTVVEYHQMIASGVLAEDEAVELIEGWIVPKMPRDARHDATIELVDDALSARLPAGYRVRVQSAVTTGDSEPEPDLAVVRGSPRDRAKQHPGAAEVVVLIEVAGSSLTIDRRDKGRLYARAGFAVYWIVNLAEDQIEAYTEPVATAGEPFFRSRLVYGRGEQIPLVIAGQDVGAIAVDDLLAD